MNIEQANTISIAKILETIGIKPSRQSEREAWYLSPLRDEKTASFKVHLKRNLWYDFGIGIGGDTVRFVCSLLESHKQPCSVADALKWLNESFNEVSFKQPQQIADQAATAKAGSTIKSVRSIKHKALIHYLDTRGIPITVADRILKEVRFQHNETASNIFALGLQNEDNGYEVRNPFYKGCVGAKNITFLRGKEVKPDGIHIFEGFMDYLSVLTQQEGRPFKDDTIILNSLSCIKHAIPYIKDYGYKVAYTWMDNDLPGQKALKLLDEFLSSQPGLQHKPMNHLYKPFKDVNAWHTHSLGL